MRLRARPRRVAWALIPNMMDLEGRERDSSIKSSRRIHGIKRERRRKIKNSSLRAVVERGKVTHSLASLTLRHTTLMNPSALNQY